MNNQIHGVRRAAEFSGSQKALAIALKVTSGTVNQWLVAPDAKNFRPVPPKKCVRIEQLTKGEVSRRDLRPGDWEEIWPELIGSECALPTRAAEQGA